MIPGCRVQTAALYLNLDDMMECPGGSLRAVLQLCEGLMPSRRERVEAYIR